ncbi:MAG: DUF885 family protein [Vicinamibacterales bacterium]
MPDTQHPVSHWLDRFFASYYRHRPVNATFIGVHDHDARLPDCSERGLGDQLAETESLLAESEPMAGAVDDLPPALALDLRLARGFLAQQRWELTGRHFQRGNPSFHTGEAAFGVMSLFLGHSGALAERVDAARQRLEGMATLFAQSREVIREAPTAWTDRAIRECDGLLAFLDDIGEVPGADAALTKAAAGARVAAADHRHWLETELHAHPTEGVAAGDEALDLYLRQGHFLTDEADAIVEYAEAQIDEADAWAREHARDFGANTPQQALAALEDLHPSLEGYLPRYQEIWNAQRELAERERLVTWPYFPIRYVPRPFWSRRAASSLYFLFYRSPAAFNRPAVHDYLVTPISGEMPPDQRSTLLRAHNDSVIKLNHVVHHGGLGHHVQNWNAFRAESRVGRIAAVDCASRIAMACGGTMAEGWACYATDLAAEFGGLTPLEAYAERHGRMRMAARTVVDIQLHRGRFTLEQAVSYYVKRAGMSEAAASGEAVKNSLFPGAAVIYLMGTDAIHRLRRDMAALEGSAFDLRRFHDTFLSYGSVPVALVAEDMKRRAAERAESDVDDAQ